MADEATLIFQTHLPIPFTCADGTGITKGTPLVLSDPMTAAAVNASSGSVCAGIAYSDKIAGDGKTKIDVLRYGIFKVTVSGSCTVGDPMVQWANRFSTAAVNAENVWGVALETATNGETILFELKPTTMQLA